MNHYVITRTTTWRIEAKDWKAARKGALDREVGGSTSSEIEMVELETGREEVLSG